MMKSLQARWILFYRRKLRTKWNDHESKKLRFRGNRNHTKQFLLESEIRQFKFLARITRTKSWKCSQRIY